MRWPAARPLEAVIDIVQLLRTRLLPILPLLAETDKADIACMQWWSAALPLLILLSILLLSPLPCSIMPLSDCISGEMRFPLIN